MVSLKSWAIRLAQRRGLKRAKVTLARKLAVVLHRMWMDGSDFRFTASAVRRTFPALPTMQTRRRSP